MTIPLHATAEPDQKARVSAQSREQLRRLHERRILDHLEGPHPVTQRGLASELGIALGLTNLLIRGLVRKGWIRVRRLSTRHVRYLITPAGAAARARLTREYFLNTLTFYRESRDRMRERLAEVAAAINADDGNTRDQPRDVVFYGAGPVAEVAYVCLQETNLRLIGVVDGVASRPLFQTRVHPPSDLDGSSLLGREFQGLVVMPLQDESAVRAQLAAHQVPDHVVFWV